MLSNRPPAPALSPLLIRAGYTLVRWTRSTSMDSPDTEYGIGLAYIGPGSENYTERRFDGTGRSYAEALGDALIYRPARQDKFITPRGTFTDIPSITRAPETMSADAPQFTWARVADEQAKTAALAEPSPDLRLAPEYIARGWFLDGWSRDRSTGAVGVTLSRVKKDKTVETVTGSAASFAIAVAETIAKRDADRRAERRQQSDKRLETERSGLLRFLRAGASAEQYEAYSKASMFDLVRLAYSDLGARIQMGSHRA